MHLDVRAFIGVCMHVCTCSDAYFDHGPVTISREKEPIVEKEVTNFLFMSLYVILKIRQ